MKFKYNRQIKVYYETAKVKERIKEYILIPNPKSYHNDYYKTRRKKIKITVLKYYSKGKMCCKDCGDNIIESLTIDHINNNGALHRKNLTKSDKINFMEYLIKNNYPKGYQVLCIRCNWLKGKVTKKRYKEIMKMIKHDKKRIQTNLYKTTQDQS